MPEAIVDLMKKTINVTINGRSYEEDVKPRLLLTHFGRPQSSHTGMFPVRSQAAAVGAPQPHRQEWGRPSMDNFAWHRAGLDENGRLLAPKINLRDQ
jgi:hypothetical protein